MKPASTRSPLARLQSLWPALLLLVLGLATLIVATLVTLRPGSDQGAGLIGGPFALQTAEGGILREADMRGAPYLLVFGFTHCPDVCPTTLMALSEILKAAGPKGQRLRALFITVDPERDTAEVMKSYLGSFDPRISGLTGTRPEIDAVLKAFRGYARKVPLKDGDYTMDHSALVYLMDAKGRFQGTFNLDRTPEEAARDLLRQL